MVDPINIIPYNIKLYDFLMCALNHFNSYGLIFRQMSLPYCNDHIISLWLLNYDSHIMFCDIDNQLILNIYDEKACFMVNYTSENLESIVLKFKLFADSIL